MSIAPEVLKEAAAPSMDRLREELDRTREEVARGNARAVDRQHSLGKRTARERLALLLDEGSFLEIEMLRRHRA
ncbi:carboxyl transferase domain-containing protein, partial [Nonomuraea sp. NPDC004297]